jgi:hypothetical protein
MPKSLATPLQISDYILFMPNNVAPGSSYSHWLPVTLILPEAHIKLYYFSQKALHCKNNLYII